MHIKEILDKLMKDLEKCRDEGTPMPLGSDERAYRRGYLHGAIHRDIDPDLDFEEIEKWRQNRSSTFKTF